MVVSRKQKPNVIVVVSDTLRADCLGCYGNRRVYTPNLDDFAKEAVVFDCAYPESLPTIPFRRSLHTGRRAYPFRNYKPLKWLTVYKPGWQPMDPDEDTLAENLADIGYYTGFVTDTQPYFSPGMNFTRGFYQWEFVRGQLKDRWRSPNNVPTERLVKYGDPEDVKRDPIALQYLANTAYVHSEDDTTTAKVFRWAANFLEDNLSAQPFYLLVDCWDPHEAWEAPNVYLRLYAKPGYKGRTILHPIYGPWDKQMTQEELEHTVANYYGLVSLVDNWFGYFIGKVKQLGLWDNSVIIFVSDHGTNLGDNPEHIIGKPNYSLYPGLMHIPLIVRFPKGEGAGRRFNQFVYNTDITATIYDLIGLDIHSGVEVDGQSLYSLVRGNEWEEREYLTCRYGDNLWYRDRTWWVILDISGQARGVFNVQEDPGCQYNLVSSSIADEVAKKAWQAILKDADGDLPTYQFKETDALGRGIAYRREEERG